MEKALVVAFVPYYYDTMFPVNRLTDFVFKSYISLI